MNLKNRKTLIRIVIPLLVVVLFSLLFYFNIHTDNFLAIPPQGCRLTTSGIVPTTFTCQGDLDDKCTIYGSGVCTTQSTQSSVNFRTSSNTYSNGWIAIDSNNDGAMEGWNRKGSYSGSTYNTRLPQYGGVKLNITAPGGYKVYKCMSTYSSCYHSEFRVGEIGVVTENSLIVYSGSNYDALTSNFPIQGYEGKESYSSYLYVCSAQLKKGTGELLQQIDFHSNEVSNMPNTNNFDIVAGTTVNYGAYNINYQQFQCGSCGECVVGERKCITDTTYFDCVSDGGGCGVKSILPVPLNKICTNDVVSDCNDNNICTTDTRGAEETSCSFSPIPNCCKQSTDCNDGNQCTADSCISNRCVFTPQVNCCTPACDSNTHYCKNQVCELKKGCSFNNPACPSPQTCDNTKDVDPTTFGTCVCPTTPEYCSSSIFNSEKCENNKIYVCANSGVCLTWQLKQSCGDTEICI